MIRISALILFVMASVCQAAPPIIDIGGDSYAINPTYQFDQRKTFVPSSVSSATYATNAGTLAGLTTSQIIAISTGLTPTQDLTPYLKRDQTTTQVTTGTFKFDRVQFSTTSTPSVTKEGQLQWNATDGTLDLGMHQGNVAMQIGQEMFIKVRNNTGGTLSNGKVVYFVGRLGNRPTVAYAKGDSTNTCCVVGMITEDIPDNTDGFVTSFGYVRSIKTDYAGWAEGDKLYVSASVAGEVTNIEPQAPNHSDVIGTVGIVHQNLGSILVSIERHTDLTDLADVNGTPLTTTGQFPVWDNTRGVFDFTGNSVDIGLSTASLQTQITATALSTGTIVPNLLASTNTWTGGNYWQGSISNKITVITSTTPYTITSNDNVIIASCTVGNISIIIPVSSTCIGRNYSIWNVSNNTYTVTVTPSGTEKIRGTTSKTLSTGSRIDIQSIGISGREWW